MSTHIHPNALVAPTATIHPDAYIGPFCVIGPNVTIGANTRLISHVVVDGHTTIGAGNTIYPFATLGLAPQDLKYAGEESCLVVGDDNQIREHVTIHLGTSGDSMETRIGSRNLLMVGVHVAHDCVIGNDCVLANNATLAGHVHLDDFVTVGGLTAIHQFVHVGPQAMLGGMSGVEADVIPFGVVMGNRAGLKGLNLIGLERRGFTKDDITQLRGVYRALFAGQGTFADRLSAVREQPHTNPHVKTLIDFVTRDSKRGLCHPVN